MSEFLDAALLYPTVIYTTLMGVVMVYWSLVFFGALDIDFLDVGEASEGLLEGGADGVADGVADGAADGLVEGGIEAKAGVLAASLHEVHDASAILDLMSSLRLRSAPVTVVASFVILFGWVISFALNRYVAPWVPIGHPAIFGTLALAGSFVASTLLTSVVVRPLAPVFRTSQAITRSSLIGMTCQIRTSRVTDRFGQAELHDGGAGLILDVRCSAENTLGRGDEVLIVDFDQQREVFVVEPLDRLIAQGEV